MPGRYKGFAASLVVLMVLVRPIPSHAGPYEDGDAAFRRNDYDTAMKYWQPLANGQDARAQAGIAAMYLGGLGVPPDYKMALIWSERAAHQGNAKAQYLLGSMYRDGKGVQKDLARAMDLFRLAAEQNLHWAQYTLGLMYLLGEGVPSDRLEAYHWFALASAVRHDDDAQEHATAAFLLEEVSAKLTPDQISQAKQRVGEWKPAQSLRDK
jgi:TPR repeat protein